MSLIQLLNKNSHQVALINFTEPKFKPSLAQAKQAYSSPNINSRKQNSDQITEFSNKGNDKIMDLYRDASKPPPGDFVPLGFKWHHIL